LKIVKQQCSRVPQALVVEPERRHGKTLSKLEISAAGPLRVSVRRWRPWTSGACASGQISARRRMMARAGSGSRLGSLLVAEAGWEGCPISALGRCWKLGMLGPDGFGWRCLAEPKPPRLEQLCMKGVTSIRIATTVSLAYR
jgi:hypothetical protein